MIFYSLLAVVLLAPLAIGAVYPWAWGSMASLVAVLLLAWAVRVLAGRERPAVSLRRLWWTALPVALAWLYGLVQTLGFVPEAMRHPLWASAASLLGRELPGSVSVDPTATLDGLLRLLAYGAIVWLALQYGRQRRFARMALGAVALAAGVYSLYGVIVFIADTKQILWFAKTSYTQAATATFVNHNSFAAYAGLGLLSATGMLMQGARDAVAGLRGRAEVRLRLLEYLTSRSWPFATAWLICAVGLYLSNSRGGLLATLVGLVVFFALTGAGRDAGRRWTLAAGTLFAVALAGFYLLSGQTTAERFGELGEQSQARLTVYGTTLEAIGDAPLAGTGLGSFASVYRMYRPDSVEVVFRKAHNTYLENALELGVPAALLLTLGIAALALHCARGAVRRQRDATLPAVGAAAAGLVGAHSLVDFSLQIPAVSATFALILGVAGAQAWSSRSDTGA